MLTLKIEDRELESIFVNQFHSDMKSFVAFIKQSFSKSESIKIEDNWSYLQPLIDEAEESGISDKTHEEIWSELFKKYNVA